MTGVATQLQRGHIPFGVVTRSGLGHLSQYRVVLLPDVLRMDEEEIRAFRAYVEAGGCLYASGRTSLLSTDGSRRSDFGLADVFGAHFSTSEHGSGLYLRARSPQLLEAIQPEVYFGYGFPPSGHDRGPRAQLGVPRLATSYEATALATLDLPFGYPSPGSRDGRDFASIHTSPPWQNLDNPVIVANGFGRGKSVYSVAPIEVDTTEAGMKTFAALITDLLGGPPTLGATAPADIWLTAFDQPEHHRVVVSALCYRADERPQPFPLSFTYRVPGDRRFVSASEAVTGTEVPSEAGADGAVTVSLERVDLFGMYLLDYQPST